MSIYVKIRMYTYVYIGGETYVYINIKNIGVIYAYTYIKIPWTFMCNIHM